MSRGVVIFAIEAEDVITFSEDCTPRVKEAIPRVEDLVLKEVEVDATAGGRTGESPP